MTDDCDWSEGPEDKDDGSDDRKPAFSFKDVPLPELVLVPLAKARLKLDKMLDLKNKIAVADQKHHLYLKAVGNLAQEFLIEYHDHLQKHPMKCRALTYANGEQNVQERRQDGRVDASTEGAPEGAAAHSRSRTSKHVCGVHGTHETAAI